MPPSTPPSHVTLGQPETRSYRSAGGALGLSLLIPGAGQIYNGEGGKAFYIWLGLGVSAGATLLAQSAYNSNGRANTRGFFQGYAVGILLGAAVYFYGAVDAYTSAQTINYQIQEAQRMHQVSQSLPPVDIIVRPDGIGVTYKATF